MSEGVLEKIKQAGLVGRGGAEFPTWKKWEAVSKAEADKKYVICNASEGELGLFKDIHVLEHHLEDVFKGLKAAMDYVGAKEAFFNFNKDYYKKVRKNAEYLARQYRKEGVEITFFKEEPSYIGGEETALLEAIEGRCSEPRLKPPYPSDAGLFGKPTLIHNVETLFDINAVLEGSYEGKRFYCISKNGTPLGVAHMPADWSIEQVLKEAGFYPEEDFFVQIGGSASGLVLNKEQLSEEKMIGAGSIEIYPADMDPKELLQRWFDFYAAESCGKCTPCKAGSYNLASILKKNTEIPWGPLMELIEAMEKTSFCALGKSIALPVRSLRKNILKLDS